MPVQTKPSASSGVISVVEEINYGETPSSLLQIIDFSSESLKKDVNTLEDDSIDSGEQTVNAKQAGVGASGDINMNMKMDNDDIFMEGLMKEEFSVQNITLDGISAVASTNTLEMATGDFTSILSLGQFIKPAGFSQNNFNRPVKIIEIAPLSIKLVGIDLVDETPVNVTFKGKTIKNGTTLKSFSIEKKFKDKNGSDVFFAYKGACINSLSLAMPTEDKITETFNVLAKDEESPDVSIGTGYNQSVAGNMLDSANNLVYVLMGNSEIVPASISNLNIENNLRMQKGVGSKYLQGVGKGKQKISGTMELYFDDKTIYEKFKNNSEDSLDIVIQEEDGSKWIVFSLPNIKYTEYPVNLSGTEDDIVSNVSFTAIKDNVINKQMIISKYSI